MSASPTQLLERAVLLLLFAGLLLGILAVLRPFTTGILFGAILAIAAWPLRDSLLRRGLRRGLVATLLLERQLPLGDDAEREALVRRCLHVQHAGLGR